MLRLLCARNSCHELVLTLRTKETRPSPTLASRGHERAVCSALALRVQQLRKFKICGFILQHASWPREPGSSLGRHRRDRRRR
eukprot:3344801-Rhodomonas_salina.1